MGGKQNQETAVKTGQPPPNARPQPGLLADFRSKLLDGLLPAAVLYLLLMLILFGVSSIQAHFNGPGLLLYVLGLLAVAVFSLQRALALGLAETTRGWYGMAAGVLAWSVVEISRMLEPVRESGLRGSILLVLVGLVGALLWRRSLPLGGRFFWITFCANWVGSLFTGYLRQTSNLSPALTLFTRGIGFCAAAAASILLLWMLFRSRRRVQRMWASLAVVMLGAFAVVVLNGGF